MSRVIKEISIMLACMLSLVICACTSVNNDNASGQSIFVETGGTEDNTDEAGKEAGKEAGSSASTAESGTFVDDNDKDNNSEQEETPIIDHDSISEYFRQCDPNRETGGVYQKAIEAYEASLGQETIDLLIEEIGGIGYPRISSGYVDDDEIPELFLGLGNFHPSGIYVFTYLPDREEVVRVGDFSSFGKMTYIERGNRIKSEYGGGGAFLYIFTEIKEGKPILTGSIAQKDRKKENVAEGEDDYEIVYYAGYSLPEGENGSRESGVDFDWDVDPYSVSEEEYLRQNEELSGNPDQTGKREITVNYESMPTVAFAQGGYNLLEKKDELDGEKGDTILDLAFPDRTGSWMAYQRIYEVVKDSYRLKNEETFGYDLMDINGDGETELIIFCGNDHLDGVQLYSFISGKAIYLGCFGEWGKMEADPDKHIIRSRFTGFDSVYDKYYEIKGSEVVLLTELDDISKKTTNREGEHEYRTDGTVVSKEEYEHRKSVFEDYEFVEFKNGVKHNGGWMD